MHHFIYLALMLHASIVVASDGITPTAPGPGDKFNAGSPCTIQWETGEDWSNFSISLMSGSNTQMQLVTTVASGLDGSDSTLSPFNWTCPDVDPYSAIYFYQFTNGNDTTNSKWTTRFTIASPSGESSSPMNSTQPNGDAIPWGLGTLAAPTSTAIATSSPSVRVMGIASESTSSTSYTRMRKAKMSATSIERQATPTIAIPSSPTTTSAYATGTAFAAYQNQNGNGAHSGWSQAFGTKFSVVFVLVIIALS
ncbi:hypothetical protein F5878DRAFT_720183 [Lentinula raphanica]|uniref:Yeast cell wall synthesis Kre9/Knh1-like N-terminal domain-containing protein n=1 Tax=Lentinula raphanica TaxID=153919 RepID=A0AA38PLI0_9AGAR|nr:hypothetical protein F5878DRAFT_720183 [Lentinula raphanica]